MGIKFNSAFKAREGFARFDRHQGVVEVEVKSAEWEESTKTPGIFYYNTRLEIVTEKPEGIKGATVFTNIMADGKSKKGGDLVEMLQQAMASMGFTEADFAAFAAEGEMEPEALAEKLIGRHGFVDLQQRDDTKGGYKPEVSQWVLESYFKRQYDAGLHVRDWTPPAAGSKSVSPRNKKRVAEGTQVSAPANGAASKVNI